MATKRRNKLTELDYNNAKGLLAKGDGIKQVQEVTGLGEMTVRRIKKAKSWRSYQAISRNSSITAEQRKLMNQGHTLKEARAMLRPAKPQPGIENVEPELEDVKPDDLPKTEPEPTPDESVLANVDEDDELPMLADGDPTDFGDLDMPSYKTAIVVLVVILVVGMLLIVF